MTAIKIVADSVCDNLKLGLWFHLELERVVPQMAM